ncbi:hypothetical protein, partial [Desulfonatronum thioautotrophicum]|uniref:hypothetical protein n=1 Tax=Desulfonatronum thioautotrophicum TaxID=617001 RepID=UPI001ABF29B1
MLFPSISEASQTSQISDSYSRATVSGSDYVGGLVGKLASGTIDGSYSAGQVSGTEGGVGGLLGENVSGVIISSYWDILTSGQTYSAGGDGRSTQQMIYPLAEDTFAGWDFQSVWALDPAHSTNNGYPFHRKVSQDPSDGGPLSVTIAPRNATAAGALWRVKGRGGWNASGHVVENLAPGEYIVEFKTAFGWIQPGDMTVQVGASPLSVTGTYSYLADLRTMVQFVESYYLNTYSDIRGAVQRRQLPSGWHHYVLSGRFENRRPNAFFDPDYYMNRYPDIGQAIRAGTYPGTAFDHFVASGLWEGRIPSAVFESFDARTYLAANPDLARHIPAHIGSAF